MTAGRDLVSTRLTLLKEKSYPFEVELSGYRESVALADQVTYVDWRARKVTKKGVVTALELADIRAKAKALIG
ncbi:hypothetical protein O3T15_14205 [Serratia marcescens]|nr:hypothetical protein O3T15_14205 [Serratia marcescens]